MNHKVLSISQRMSLRQPQEDSLNILAKICDLLPLEKGADIARCLEIIKKETGISHFEDFEHSFPSFCFSLATGVGKTRLMGAFITYLFITEGIKNFFILAPNLTIYEKLKNDFKPNTPKYVFHGISEFALKYPIIITGEDYETGKGVESGQIQDVVESVYINIFNVSKINSEVRGGKAPRIKRLSECIGESYFDYLANLDDLVLIMDESHRYRADAGMKAINELNPILGLELTATPQIERGTKSIPFKNVVYNYPLAAAMRDGFVKEPQVATRKDFDPKNYSADSLETLKLEDGVRIHENTKAELELYARQYDKPYVKPFILIVAEDTAHAESILETIKSDKFFEGRYKDRAITVHSKQSGAEQDEMIAKLLAVEDHNNPTEIVIHVNKLSEGWDVTNLYTIIPLRAANSRTLVEQSIGRGLRLPYGRRTGVEAVDALTIVSHDKFQEIVEDARKPDSVIKRGIIIGQDIPEQGVKAVTVEPILVPQPPVTATKEPTPEINQAEVAVKREVLKALKGFENLQSSSEILKPENINSIIQKVTDLVSPRQGSLPGYSTMKPLANSVKEALQIYCNYAIDIPRIIVVPLGEVNAGFRDFDLEPPTARPQPIDQEILLQSLEDEGKRYLKAELLSEDKDPEDYIVSGLMDYDDVNYDEHARLLYKLAKQMVGYLRTYLKNDEEVRNVILNAKNQLVDLIHAQMEKHYDDGNAKYEAKVSKGFITLDKCDITESLTDIPREFRKPVEDLSRIRQMVFFGFKKCFFPKVKFDSDSERLLVCILEDDNSVRRWLRPTGRIFQIDYRHGEGYEPDFVVEAETDKYLLEVKRRSDLEHPDVLAKKDAAVTYCRHATGATGIKWHYVLIPHDAVVANASFGGLVSKFRVQA